MPDNYQEKREISKKTMLEIVEYAYDQKMITKEHSHGEVIYKIRLPHESIEAYALVADHDV